MDYRQKINMRTLGFVKAIRLFFLVFAILFPTERCNSTEPVVFPLPHFEEALIVPVGIAGEDHLFVLDTGASVNVFDIDLKNLLGEPLKRGAISDAQGKHVEVESYAPPVAHLSKIAIAHNAPVACMDLTNVRAATGREIKGILGLPFFATNIIQVDFDQRQLRIFPTFTKPSTEWGEAVAVVDSESNLPAVNTRFGTYANEPCVIDLGFSGTISPRADLFDYLLESDVIIPIQTTHMVTLGGVTSSKKGLLSEFELAGYTHKRLAVIRSKSAFSRVGLSYFRRYLVTFDLRHSQMYLAKGFDFNNLDEDEKIGIALLRKDERTVVEVVYSDSQAAKAGFRKDDELVSLAGEDISRRPLAEIVWIIRTTMKTDSRLIVGVRRAGVMHSLTVTSAQ